MTGDWKKAIVTLDANTGLISSNRKPSYELLAVSQIWLTAHG